MGLKNFLERADDFSIARKVLLLVLVPLAIQACFILVLWYVQNHLTEGRRWTNHSTEVVYRTENSLADFSGGFNRTLLFLFSTDEKLKVQSLSLLDDARKDLKLLREQVKDSPTQYQRVIELQAVYEDFRKICDEIIYLSGQVSGEQPEREANVKRLRELLLTASQAATIFRGQLNEFLKIELGLYYARASGFNNSLNKLVMMLSLGTLGTLVIGLVAYRILRLGFIERMSILMNNLATMGTGGELGAPLRGHDELGQLDRAMHTLSESLAERDQETELFIYSVSHDLRSPLVNLSGFSDEIASGIKDLRKLLDSEKDKAEIRKESESIIQEDIGRSLEFIKTATIRMSNIIAALLRLSRVGRLEYKIEKIELTPVVQKIVDTLKGSLDEAHAVVKLGSLPEAYADAQVLEQVFLNLITNSLKYRDPSRTLLIEIDHKVSDDDYCTIFVRDNGLGIPESAHPKLFLAFQRFHQQVASGDGVGLAIVRRIISRLKGKISCESTSGNGATFYICLPLTKSEVDITAAAVAPYPYQAEEHYAKNFT